MPLGLRLGDEHHDVVGENHDHADDEAAQLAVPRHGKAQREADDGEHEARHGDRELLLDVIDLGVRGEPGAQLGLPVLAQLPNRFLGDPAGELSAPEHVLRIQRHRQVVGPGVGLGLAGLSRGVPRAVRQDQIDPSIRTAEHQTPPLGEVELCRVLPARVRDQDVPPVAARVGGVADVKDPARKVLEEHARPDVALDLLADHVEGDFPEFLVGVRDGLDHHVLGRGRGDEGHEHDRPEQPVGADAAGQQSHRLTIGGQAPEADQQARQQGHRNREAERRGGEGQDDQPGGLPGHALGDQRLEVAHDRGDLEQERENDEREEERRNDLADDVTVDGSQHLGGYRAIIPGPGAERKTTDGRLGQEPCGASANLPQPLFSSNISWV